MAFAASGEGDCCVNPILFQVGVQKRSVEEIGKDYHAWIGILMSFAALPS